MKLDRTGKRQRWAAARRAESHYSSRLVQVARQVGHIIRGFAPVGIVTDQSLLRQTLEGYAEVLTPWAWSVANYMVADVQRRDLRMWEANSAEMSRAIRGELQEAPTGILRRALMNEQVVLIKSLPLEAAQRVHVLTTEALVTSKRAAEVQKEIMRSGEVTASRAKLIARTDVARTAATFTQARAQFAGSEGYIWRTSTDGDVRPTHQEMEGRYVRWDTPPKTDKNLAPYHAGCGPNCRCFAEPVLPDL